MDATADLQAGANSAKNDRFRPWRDSRSIPRLVFFALTVLLLPFLPITSTVYSWIVSPFTDWATQYLTFAPRAAAPSEDVWLLSGLMINLVSIFYAIFGAIGNNETTKFDRSMQCVYGVVICFSGAAILFLRWIGAYIAIISVVYYFIYFITDLVGTHHYSDRPADQITYTFPLFCLDGPALFTSIVIVCVAGNTHFVDGMAAGHLVFGSFAYLGVVGLVLPWVLHKVYPQAPNGVAMR